MIEIFMQLLAMYNGQFNREKCQSPSRLGHLQIAMMNFRILLISP